MTNAADSRFPTADEAHLAADDHALAESIEHVIGLLKAMLARTGKTGAGSEVDRSAGEQLRRLQWILCKKTYPRCAQAAELGAGCDLRQGCLLLNMSSIPTGQDAPAEEAFAA